MSYSSWTYQDRARTSTLVSQLHPPRRPGRNHMSNPARPATPNPGAHQLTHPLGTLIGNFMVSLDLINYDGRTAYNVSRPVSSARTSSATHLPPPPS